MNSYGQILEFSVVSLYEFTPRDDILSTFYRMALSLFEEFKTPPKIIGTGLSKGLKDYGRTKKRLEADGLLLARTKDIEMYSQPYDGKDPKNGCDLEFAISTGKKTYCYVIFCPSLLSIGHNRLLQIANQFIELVQPSYGIGFKRFGRWGPSFFALGLGFGDYPKEESRRIINFRETTWDKRYLKGNLGGIFPWNFLTTPQLSARVGNQSLEDWIQGKPNRGTLQKLTDAMVLWAVPDEDIAEVYQALWEAEVVFDYERYCNSFFKKGAAPAAAPEKAVGEILQKMGYQSTDEVQVFKVDEPGKLRELSRVETRGMLQRKKSGPKDK